MHACRPKVMSALAVLGRLAGLLQAVLLALGGAWITGQEAGLLQRGPVLRRYQNQCPGDTQAQRAGLTRRAAAAQVGKDVETFHPIHGDQGALINCWCTLFGK